MNKIFEYTSVFAPFIVDFIHGKELQGYKATQLKWMLLEFDKFFMQAATGLQVHLSEVDIIFNRHNDQRGGGVQIYNALSDEMAQRQGEKYRRLAEMYREIVPPEQQYGITVLGFNDRTTWIRPFFNLKDWPTLYDDNLRKKPAYYGLLDGLRD